MLVTKVLLDPLWCVLQHRHVFSRRCTQLGLGSHRNLAANRMLQICVQPLLWVELRAVAGQVEQFNVLFVLCRPLLDYKLGMIYS